MKKFYDLKKFILDSEEELKLNPEAKIKTLKEESLFISDILNIINLKINKIKELPSEKIIDESLNDVLKPREKYTLKKEALDFLCENLYKQKDSDFFKYYSYIKITKSQDHGLPVDHLKTNQVAYLYLCTNELAVLKTTKSMQILDATDGNAYGIVNHFQETFNDFFHSSIDNLNVKYKFPMTLGILVLE
jgi:hypothetical protein